MGFLHHARIRYGLPDLLHQIFPFLGREPARWRAYARFQLIQPSFKASEHLPGVPSRGVLVSPVALD